MEKIQRKKCIPIIIISIDGGVVMRVKITLACSECKQRNYNTMKNKKNDPDRLEMNKYCKFCRKHTLHKETK
jgi:large subunit ribosomal protein L33